jgi:Family of unknown function (DUF5906)
MRDYDVIQIPPGRLADIIDIDTKLRHDEFYAFAPTHKFIYRPSCEHWTEKSVNKRLPMRGNLQPGEWLDRHRSVTQITWWPGLPELIEGKAIRDGGMLDADSGRIFNEYRAPDRCAWCEGDVSPWLDHIELLYGDACSRIVHFFAHRVQRPEEKINHAKVLGGTPGVGKDMLLKPVRFAVGQWNCASITAEEVLGKDNDFIKSVFLTINEANDLGDSDRRKFYERSKLICAAPPDFVRVNVKYIPEFYVPNVCGVAITTNHKTDGLYFDANDRRHDCLWTEIGKEHFDDAGVIEAMRRRTGVDAATYWDCMQQWYEHGGYEAIGHYLATLDLSAFDPKAAPPKTEMFYEIVNTNRPSEDAAMEDLLDGISNAAGRDLECTGPDVSKHGRVHVVTVAMLIRQTERMDGADDNPMRDWLRDKKNSRSVPKRLDEAGYVVVRNPDDKTRGYWKVGGRRTAVYGRKDLTERERQAAAAEL